jgi:hypothetical protein
MASGYRLSVASSNFFIVKIVPRGEVQVYTVTAQNGQLPGAAVVFF